ncbi:MAG: hypothetical protein QXP36_04210 [Conexivisphaerales archaeon]|uniref:hypothetical protein n=1 Tax=Saccharolobus sp. TaxID=2100761 RepID=UPI00317A3757
MRTKELLALLETPINFSTLCELTCIPRHVLIKRLHDLMRSNLVSRIPSEHGYLYFVTEKGLIELYKLKWLKPLEYRLKEVAGNVKSKGN